MNPLDLTVSQLKRAAANKKINREFEQRAAWYSRCASQYPTCKKNRTISTAAKKKIAAAQKARWANLRRASPARQSVTPRCEGEKEEGESGNQSEVIGQIEAYWAAKKKAGKK